MTAARSRVVGRLHIVDVGERLERGPHSKRFFASARTCRCRFRVEPTRAAAASGAHQPLDLAAHDLLADAQEGLPHPPRAVSEVSRRIGLTLGPVEEVIAAADRAMPPGRCRTAARGRGDTLPSSEGPLLTFEQECGFGLRPSRTHPAREATLTCEIRARWLMRQRRRDAPEARGSVGVCRGCGRLTAGGARGRTASRTNRGPPVRGRPGVRHRAAASAPAGGGIERRRSRW
jgi:hypothetical protein